MKNKLASTVIALVLCTFFSFGNTTIAFANSTDDAVDSIEETECTDCLTDEEYHDYQMWLLETEEHMDESKLYSNGISTYSNDLDYSYSGSCGDDVTYSYNMETKILSIGGDGKMWDFMFNDVHTSVPWSEYRSEIEGVEIGANVTYIGSGAFSYLTALTYVSIPSTVSEIGMYSFANCINLTSVSVHSQYINQCAFQSCRSLTTIDLNGVKTISWRAFGACNALTSVDISDSVSEIWQPFYNCMSIESVNVSENNSYFASVDGVLYDKDLTVLYYYPANKSGSSYTIPDSITRVSSYAFAYNKNLHEINFPSECRLDEYVLQDSNYIEHWAEYDSDYRYYYGRAYYLVVNGVLLDVKNVDGSTITMLDFSNIIYRDGSSRWVTKVDLQKPDNFSNVISVLGTELIDIQHNCLSETAWFKNSDVNVIYDNPDPEQATFKLLYSYRGSSNLVHAETYTHIGASAFSEWESDSETGLTIYLSSENTTIDDEMLCNAPIDNIYVDGNLLTLKDVQISKDIINMFEENSKEYCYVNSLQSDNFSYQMTLAVSSNQTYFRKLADIYCQNILNELNIDAYKTNAQKIKVIYDWMHDNFSYAFFACQDDDGDIINPNNNNRYSTNYYLTYCASAHLLTGYGVCASYTNVFNIFADLMGINSFYVGGFGHAWNLVEVNERDHIWYYLDLTWSWFLHGQNDVTDDAHIHYRKEDKENDPQYIDALFPNHNYSNDENTISDTAYEPIIKKNITISKALTENYAVNLNVSDMLYHESTTNGVNAEHYLFGETSYFNDLSVSIGEEIIYTFHEAADLEFTDEITGSILLEDDYTVNYSISNNNGFIDIQVWDGEVKYISLNDYPGVFGYYLVESNGITTKYTTSSLVSLGDTFSIRFYDINENLIESVSELSFIEKTGYMQDLDAAYRISSGTVNEKTAIIMEAYTMGDITMDGVLDENDSMTLLRVFVRHYSFIQTGSTSDLNLGNGNITINGDISANGTFTLQAQDANVNGQLSAANFANYVNGNLNMNKIPNDITITEDYVETVFSDEYMQNIYFADSSVVEGNYEISNPNINISETTIVDGAISLNGNVNVNSNLKANGDISITGNVENTVNSVIYSQDGNITLNSDNVNFDGFIYAPNGKVTIEGSNVTINGIIIAESLEIKGNNVVFNVSDVLGANNDDFNVTLNAFQFMLADVNFDNVVEFLDAIRLNQKIASLSA